MTNLSKEAYKNRKLLINQFVVVIVANKEYEFKIDNITRNEIFIQKKFYFEELVSVKYKESFEYAIQNLIIGSDDLIDNPMELRQRSLFNKENLKHKMFSITIGDKKHGFRIISITNRYIKIENVLKFDLIEKIYAMNIISLEYILHEFILGNFIDYYLFKSDESTDVEDSFDDIPVSNESSKITIDIGDIDKLSSEELESKLIEVRGWQKLVFDSIDEYEEDIFTLQILEKEPIFDQYRFQGESLIPTIEKNLFPLVDLGLVEKYDDKHYVKLW